MVIKGRLIQVLKNKTTGIFSLRIEGFPFAIDCNLNTPEQQKTVSDNLFEDIEAHVDSKGYCSCLVFDSALTEQ